MRSEISQLQIIQNAAAKVIANRYKYDHVSDVLYKLHWLKVRERITYKLMLIVFKSLCGMAPRYIQELIHYKDNDSYKSLLYEPRVLTSYGSRAFCKAAPTLWNQLPTNLKQLQDIEQFKKCLKTHLFKLSHISL